MMRFFSIADGTVSSFKDITNLGRRVMGGIAYDAYASDPGTEAVWSLALKTQAQTTLWTGPHPWNGTERVVGVGGGQVYLSLPAQVTNDGDTRPGRALARMPVTGGTPVTVVDLSDGTTCSVVAGSPSAETCNNIDDNCNGVIDDGLSCP